MEQENFALMVFLVSMLHFNVSGTAAQLVLVKFATLEVR